MPRSPLKAQPVAELVEQCTATAKRRFGRQDAPRVVISPYRFNPLGAHIDHQGGSVLARCLDQYTIVCFWPSRLLECRLQARLPGGDWQESRFGPDQFQDEHGWDAMARASMGVLSHFATVSRGVDAIVFGTLISGGLSSSASVILAYLSALADVNDIELTATDLVELCRQVENDYRGLNNGVQDQMSIAFGQRNTLAVLDVEHVKARMISDPDNSGDISFLMCYSGISRNLGGSPFNTRVAECREAAGRLQAGATHLGEVALEYRSDEALARLPGHLAQRATHVYTEMARVSAGAHAWQQGDWHTFGQLMNASCHSSIHHYESGSEWLIALHELSVTIPGVFGSRFSGGGYGGCLFMLVEREQQATVAESLLNNYLGRYPDLEGKARTIEAQSESTVRIVAP